MYIRYQGATLGVVTSQDGMSVQQANSNAPQSPVPYVTDSTPTQGNTALTVPVNDQLNMQTSVGFGGWCTPTCSPNVTPPSQDSLPTPPSTFDTDPGGGVFP